MTSQTTIIPVEDNIKTHMLNYFQRNVEKKNPRGHLLGLPAKHAANDHGNWLMQEQRIWLVETRFSWQENEHNRVQVVFHFHIV